MRIVNNSEEFSSMFDAATSESANVVKKLKENKLVELENCFTLY